MLLTIPNSRHRVSRQTVRGAFHPSGSIRTLTVLSLFFAVGIASGLAADAQAKRNVLIICIDDLRPVLGCYGGAAKTPHLDRFAASAVKFERHYVQFPSCGPSRACMMGGIRPDTIDLYGNGGAGAVANQPETRPTMPLHFRNQGFTTLSFGKTYHGKGTGQGFGWSRQPWHPPSGWTCYVEFKTKGKSDWRPAYEIYNGTDCLHGDYQTADQAIRALGENRDRPFFIATGFYKPHLPFVAPKAYWDLYDEEEISLLEPRKMPAGALSHQYAFREINAYGYRDGRDQKFFTHETPPTPAQARDLTHAYYASVSFIDAQVGRILKRLDELGLSENTAVVVWGDHGFHLGDQQRWAKWTQFEADMRSPLLIRLPGGVARPRSTEALVESVDIYPTLADYSGISLPGHLEGNSLLPLIAGEVDEVKQVALSQVKPLKTNTHLLAYSLRTAQYRYVEWRDTRQNYRIVDRELYDLGSGGGETKNLARNPDYEKVLQTCRRLSEQGYSSLRSAAGDERAFLKGGDISLIQTIEEHGGVYKEDGKAKDALAIGIAQSRYEPWKIVSAADWHSAEGGVTSPDHAAFVSNQANERKLVAGTVSCDPDVVLIAGDMGGGHWTTAKLKQLFQPGETIEHLIHRLGEKTYRSLKNNFAAAGVSRLFVCPGDHCIGDNDWPAGGERSRNVAFHRAIFGRTYNMDPTGNWLWPETVCGAPARPMGTRYQGTSFAARHKNVLFVMVDIFHQEDPDKHLHPRHGSINPDLEGEHLAWFDEVLAAGRKDKDVRYIFVQAHTPALPPVRAQSSSMMMANQFDHSNLWQTMRRHKVDLYFAGEVHATTISKDPQSDLVQIVTDRKMPTMVTVYDSKLEFQTFDRELDTDGNMKSDPLNHEHTLTIEKSGEDMVFTNGKGFLKPLDLVKPSIHYPFDEIQRSEFGSSKPGSPTTVRNHGEFSSTFDARTENTHLVEGILGKGLAFDKGGAVDVRGTGPFGLFDRTDRTLAVWFKTGAKGKYNLICGGNGLKGAKAKGAAFMDLVLQDGAVLVRTNAGEAESAGPKLNDDCWHHAALVVLPNADSLGDIRVYVDGKRRPWATTADVTQEVTAKMGIYGISLGGEHRPVWSKSKRVGNVPPFAGAIDDFSAWYRALTDAEIRTLYELAITK